MRKRWFDVLAPKLFNEVKICETLADDPNKLVGRKLEIPLSELLSEGKHFFKLLLEIEKVEEEKAKTELIGYEISRSYLMRLVKAGGSKIELIKEVATRDKKRIRVKCWILTQGRVSGLQERSLRKKMEETIEKVVKEYNYYALILTLAQGAIQKRMLRDLCKIFPVRSVEIRKLELVASSR